MGQKVNPHGLRVGVIKDWDSRWYARNEKVGDLLVEDKKIRDYLKKTLYGAGIPKICLLYTSFWSPLGRRCTRAKLSPRRAALAGPLAITATSRSA